LFCVVLFVMVRSLDYACPSRVVDTVGKIFVKRGARNLFRGVPIQSRKDIEFQSFCELSLFLFLLYYSLCYKINPRFPKNG